MQIAEIALVMLAAGRSERFGATDKLLASLDGAPLAENAATLSFSAAPAAKFAVVQQDSAVAPIFRANGWTLIENPAPGDGLSGSLKLGVKACLGTSAKALCLLLADMPFVVGSTVEGLAGALGDHDAAICRDHVRQAPPALFRRAIWEKLLATAGDRGAHAVFKKLENTALFDVPVGILDDIDTEDDLSTLRR